MNDDALTEFDFAEVVNQVIDLLPQNMDSHQVTSLCAQIIDTYLREPCAVMTAIGEMAQKLASVAGLDFDDELDDEAQVMQ